MLPFRLRDPDRQGYPVVRNVSGRGVRAEDARFATP